MLKFGNIRISEIIRMKIETIGIAAFNDTAFLHSMGEPEWRNFQQKIIPEKQLNIENIITAEIRIKKFLAKIDYLLYGMILLMKNKRYQQMERLLLQVLFLDSLIN